MVGAFLDATDVRVHRQYVTAEREARHGGGRVRAAAREVDSLAYTEGIRTMQTLAK